MINKKKVIAIIPARGGSKRLPRKNIELLAGKPMIYYTISAALRSKYIDLVYVSTEDQEIAEISLKYGAKILPRPKRLAKDNTTSEEVLEHCLKTINRKSNQVDIVVLLQPTSPLRKIKDINNTINLLRDEKNFAVSVNESGKVNGAVYAIKYPYFMKTKDLSKNNDCEFVMPNKRSIDIDYKSDLISAAEIIKRSFMKQKHALKVGSKRISNHGNCFIIAEAGVNHESNLNNAMKLIDAAADAGVDAIKFQTYNADKSISKYAKKAKYQKGKFRESQYTMLKRLQLSKADFKKLRTYSYKKKLIFLSTGLDIESVRFLTQLNVPLYKVGSTDITNFPLLKQIAKQNKTILLSTGASTMEEISDAVDYLRELGNGKIVLLQCVTNYPTKAKDANINAMKTLEENFNTLVGYSDHSEGIAISIAAVAKGACVIEKHFTLDRSMPGPDHKLSLLPYELKEMVKSIRTIEAAMGDGVKSPNAEELMIAKECRKSVVVLTDIEKGSILTEKDLGIKRAGGGISPKYYDEIIGKKLQKDITEDKALQWGDFNE